MRREHRDELLRSCLAINALLRGELDDVRKALKACSAEAKFNPNWRLQPRAPQGTIEGGQWIDGGGEAKPTGSPKQAPRRRDLQNDAEQTASFFDPIDDNPYLWNLSEHGLLSTTPTVAEFYNLRYDLLSLSGSEFTQIAQSAGLDPSELLRNLDRGSSVMSERAIDEIERITNHPGPGGLSIVIRERRFHEYIDHSGVQPGYRQRMFNEILDLAGFTPEEFEQHKLDVGIGEQFAWLLGGGGPARTPARLPYASARLRDPNYVWNLGPVTRGRIIETALGHNLPASFRVIDRFSEDGVATSIKSVDLGSITYHRPQTLERKIQGFIEAVAGFRGAQRAGRFIRESQITGRALDLVIPHTGTAEQQRIIDAAVRYGESRGVTVNVIVYP
jgi:hypothetical protein